MALVNITTISNDTMRALKNIDPPGGIELLSYKRNRGIAILKRDDGSILIKEYGYKEQEQVISAATLGKTLKTMVKREFPRSRKVRLVKLDSPDKLERKRQKI